MATLNNKFKTLEEQLRQRVAATLNVQVFSWEYRINYVIEVARVEDAIALIYNALPQLTSMVHDPRLSMDNPFLAILLHVDRIVSFKTSLEESLDIPALVEIL